MMPVLTSAPVLDQSLFPPLPPALPEGQAYHLRSTALETYDHEKLLGALVTLCARAGEWRPVLGGELGAMFRKIPNAMNLGIAVAELATEGFIRNHTVETAEGNRQYVEPTPEFVAHFSLDRTQIVGT